MPKTTQAAMRLWNVITAQSKTVYEAKDTRGYLLGIKTDLEDRLSKVYDKIEDTENLLVDVKARKRSILAEKVCGDNIYKALVFFDKMYENMNESERREFFT